MIRGVNESVMNRVTKMIMSQRTRESTKTALFKVNEKTKSKTTSKTKSKKNLIFAIKLVGTKKKARECRQHLLSIDEHTPFRSITKKYIVFQTSLTLIFALDLNNRRAYTHPTHNSWLNKWIQFFFFVVCLNNRRHKIKSCHFHERRLLLA